MYPKYRTVGKIDEDGYPYWVAQVKLSFFRRWKYILLDSRKGVIYLSSTTYTICSSEEITAELITKYKNRQRSIKYYE